MNGKLQFFGKFLGGIFFLIAKEMISPIILKNFSVQVKGFAII